MLRHSSNDENIFATAVQLTSYWRRQMTYIFFSVQHFSRSALRMLFLISICMKKKCDGVSFGVNFCIFQFDRIQKAWEQTYSNHIMQCLASSKTTTATTKIIGIFVKSLCCARNTAENDAISQMLFRPKTSSDCWVLLKFIYCFWCAKVLVRRWIYCVLQHHNISHEGG